MPRNEWPTPTEMLVMKILQERPRGAYGLEIVAASNHRVKRGSVYVLLGRLEEKGFVRVVKTELAPDMTDPRGPSTNLQLKAHA